MTLSEVCQNIIDTPNRAAGSLCRLSVDERLGRRVVVIAVCDAGLGFRRSLESAPGHVPSTRWDDAARARGGRDSAA